MTRLTETQTQTLCQVFLHNSQDKPATHTFFAGRLDLAINSATIVDGPSGRKWWVGARDARPPESKSLHFHTSFGKKWSNSRLAPPGGRRLPGNPGSATDYN